MQISCVSCADSAMSGVAVCCGIALVAGDAEEIANSCASWVQNDCCEHESSHRRRRYVRFFRVVFSQQRSGKLANQVSRQYPDQLRTCRGQGCRYEEKMLLYDRRGAMTPKKQRILARRGFKMTVVSMKAALDAEEMPFSSASRQQNMHFDLKSALDAEDMSVSSASYSVSNDQIGQQQSGKLANQVRRQYPDQLRACRGQGYGYEEKMLPNPGRGVSSIVFYCESDLRIRLLHALAV